MKSYNPTYEGILTNIEEEHKKHSDIIVNSTELQAYTAERDLTDYSINSRDNPIFTTYALDQLLNRLTIPVRFYRKNPTELQVAMFNHWNAIYNRSYLFRLVSNNVVRAVLSDKYSVIDDKDIFPTVIEQLDHNIAAPQWLLHDFHITQLGIRFKDLQTNFDRSNYQAGLVVTNSETGYSSVWVEPVVFMGPYTFYHRSVLQRQQVPMRLVHRGQVDIDRIKPMVSQAREIAQVGIVQLMEASQETMSSSSLVNFVKSIDAFSKRMADIIEEEVEKEERVNKIDAAKRILDCASTLPLFQRMSVEQEVGKLTGVFTGFRSRMLAIMED